MKKLKAFLPPVQTWLPLILCLLFNLLAFYGGRLITAHRVHHDFSTLLDAAIPLWPPAVIIYVLAFVFWVLGYIIIAKGRQDICFEVLAGEHIAKLSSFVIFIIIPTGTVRPDSEVAGPCTWLLSIIYRLDKPDMLFPSIHCLDSWIVFRGSVRCKSLSRGYRIFCCVFALMVFASTLLTKQHVILDVFGGVIVAELGLLISHLFRCGRLYSRLAQRLFPSGNA